MRYIIECPPDKFHSCKAVLNREMDSRANKDPSKVFTKHFAYNLGGDTFFIDHSISELTIELITEKQEKIIRQQHALGLC